MEIFFVYGLVLLFFVLLVVFVVAVLLKHPYEEPSNTRQASSSEQALSSATSKDSKIAYGILSLIFAGLLLIVVLSERKQTKASPT
ncbi:MAG TPA: hypothetical protein VF026_25320 [Ktedonobacteraceae bacterium]